MTEGEITTFHCHEMGVAGTTKVVMRKIGEGFEVRVGVAILGHANLSDEELAVANPFDESFHDNYAEGKGKTQEEAVESLKKNIKELFNMIWDE